MPNKPDLLKCIHSLLIVMCVFPVGEILNINITSRKTYGLKMRSIIIEIQYI